MDTRLATLKYDPDIDDTKLTFGKYKGKTPDEISIINPDYIIWMWDKFDDPHCSEALYNFCKVESARWSRTSEK